MNKLSKTILISERSKETRFWRAKRAMVLIISIAVFSIGILLVPSTWAEAQNLIVEFENAPLPLFKVENFLPGQGVTRWVKVTNKSGTTQRIATEAINVNDPNRLGDVLNLEIKEGGVRRYNDALSKFFATGENYLSDLTNNSNTTYDFIVTFYSGAQNTFQGKTLSFDILIGFQGEEGGLLPGAGGGVGGFLPPGLTILDETVIVEVGETSVTIVWTTTYSSTSRVIYSRFDGNHTLDLSDIPNYGYDYSTVENPNKVLSHSVTIYGLTPGTTYYFRCISHTSPEDSISREYSFTTKGVAGVVEEKEEEIMEERPYYEEISLAPEEIEEPLEEVKEELEEKISPLEKIKEEILKEEKRPWQEVLERGLVATIRAPFTQKLILAAIIIIGLLIGFWLIKKRKKKEKETAF